MTNGFVQCGLNHTLEYGILAIDNFRQEAYKVEHTKYYVPSMLLDSDFPYTVIGVDMNREKNDMLRQKYRNNPRIHIWDYALWHEDVESFTTHGEFAVIPEYMGPDEDISIASVPAITLNTLFSKVYELPNHGDAKIRCLHLNIESSEMNALQGVDWETFPYPDVIRIATSHWHDADIDAQSRKYCTEILHNHGYELKADPRDRTENSNYTDHEFATFYLKR